MRAVSRCVSARDPPRRIVQDAMAEANEEIAAAAFLFFLPVKQESMHCRMWLAIKSLKRGLFSTSVQIDYELASKNALHDAVPQVQVYGCSFHLGQSLWRKVQAQRLQGLYSMYRRKLLVCL